MSSPRPPPYRSPCRPTDPERPTRAPWPMTWSSFTSTWAAHGWKVGEEGEEGSARGGLEGKENGPLPALTTFRRLLLRSSSPPPRPTRQQPFASSGGITRPSVGRGRQQNVKEQVALPRRLVLHVEVGRRALRGHGPLPPGLGRPTGRAAAALQPGRGQTRVALPGRGEWARD
jgi:hypothetical protein